MPRAAVKKSSGLSTFLDGIGHRICPRMLRVYALKSYFI